MKLQKSIVPLLIIAGCGGNTFTASDSLTDASAGGAGQVGAGGDNQGTGGSASTTVGAGGSSSGVGGTSSGVGGSANGGSDGSGGRTTGTGGSQGGTGGAGTGGAGGISDAGPPTDGGACTPKCGVGRTCCGGRCVNASNDPNNCGGCGIKCMGATPYCAGTCRPAPCEGDGSACSSGSMCCGTQCCTHGQLCCEAQGPTVGPPVCFTPTNDQPTCPQGCSPLCVSDRSLKRDIEPVDPLSVLETVSKLPVSTWSYRSDADGVRHMGPMAQDFKAAFGLGDTDRGYYSVDAHGVSLAAIQALYELSAQQSLRIEGLQRENAELQRRLGALEQTQRR